MNHGRSFILWVGQWSTMLNYVEHWSTMLNNVEHGWTMVDHSFFGYVNDQQCWTMLNIDEPW